MSIITKIIIMHSGCSVTILGTAPIFALGFIGFDVGKMVMSHIGSKKNEGQMSLTRYHLAIAALISGGVTTLLMTPAERIKCLLQVCYITSRK
jgi:solute carrier family 25 carnitine/acylcarnitine transporter 20/29